MENAKYHMIQIKRKKNILLLRNHEVVHKIEPEETVDSCNGEISVKTVLKR